jgi:hypothetical protein
MRRLAHARGTDLTPPEQQYRLIYKFFKRWSLS